MTNESKSCPICGETINISAIKCRFCGEYIQDLERKTVDANFEKVIFEGNPSIYYNFVQIFWTFLTGGFIFPYYFLKSKTTKYRITNQRILIEQGIMSKFQNNVELIRVDDFSINQPISMRILGYSELVINSSDRQTPRIVINGIKDITNISELLRQYSMYERASKGIRTFAKL